ncbi:asparagine synthase (glutamine-hydrolyzing) [Vibrio alginolyticus]|uniref:asparagine synthase (glutamine-hydrolyzing) n=1 Tax=Vibrio alginolyticus TaxID=663 RepID=UPI00215BDF92|nr:asparagine synthase (glutamine-hydrolyzing) [Vibrio alginolyticus]MCS0000028.1 asparagine synthase (glutamine-hydrolyzing) [Vibrio alginolyticus]
MCGILGLIGDYNTDSFAKALNAMSHRGPDGHNVWSDKRAILGHRRLSIHDLTDAGAQPMMSNCARYVLVFNGEIYNYEKIRSQLNESFDISWNGHSDSEVLLNAIIFYGIDDTLNIIEGMFSFCFYDTKLNEYFVARDRFGEKPLFYYLNGREFIFSSMLSSIETLVEGNLSINYDAVSDFIKYGFVPSPKCIYNEVNKVEPGCVIKYSQGVATISRYYGNRDNYNHKSTESLSQSQKKINELLVNSIEEKMSSDVPLGAFLSGGVDSSLITAIMQSKSETPIKTFTIGFDVEGYNEAEFAREISDYLGTEHYEKYITAEMALNKVTEIASVIDEPISDPSIIPTLFVAELARENVTVALCGDGADEVFGGYKRYFLAIELWNKIRCIPKPIRVLLSRIITSTPSRVLDKFGLFSKYITKYGRASNSLGSKLKKLSDYISSESFSELYDRLISHTSPNENVVTGLFNKKVDSVSVNDPINYMMMCDQRHYLPGDLLAKLDTATMNYSLEGRAPFLDSRLVDYANSLPSSYKIKNGIGKYMLKSLLSEYIPEAMYSRPKLGFGVPIDYWLRNELKDWMISHLEPSNLKRFGFLNLEMISKWIKEHLSEERNNGQKIWNVIILTMWLDSKAGVIDFDK